MNRCGIRRALNPSLIPSSSFSYSSSFPIVLPSNFRKSNYALNLSATQSWTSAAYSTTSTTTSSTQQQLPQKLKDELKSAMKAAQKQRVAVIKSLLSDLTYASKSAGAAGKPEDPEIVLQKALKRRFDSVEAYKAGGRPELADAELQEISIIEEFLPKQLTPEELQAIIKRIVASENATSVKDLGKVMKQALLEIQPGSATRQAISDSIKQVLSAPK